MKLSKKLQSNNFDLNTLLVIILMLGGFCLFMILVPSSSILQKTVNFQEETEFTKIDLHYPRFEGKSWFIKRVNGETSRLINNSISEIKKYAETVESKFQLTNDPNQLPLFKRSELKIWGKATLVNPQIISLNLIRLIFYAGAAHPVTDNITMNFNLTNGSKMALKDIFRPKVDYLSFLSAYCSRDLLKQDSRLQNDAQWFKQGTAATPENYQLFYLTNRFLVIVFKSLQIGPYYIGLHEVEIPLSQPDFSKLFNPIK